MKFPRNARIFRGQLDATPYASVFFLLVIFVLLSALIYTPGIHIELPEVSASLVTGVDGPTVAVAMDKNGQLYYDNELLAADALKKRLRAAAQKAAQPLTLVVRGDKAATYEMCVQLAAMVQDPELKIKTVIWQTLPPMMDAPPAKSAQP